MQDGCLVTRSTAKVKGEYVLVGHTLATANNADYRSEGQIKTSAYVFIGVYAVLLSYCAAQQNQPQCKIVAFPANLRNLPLPAFSDAELPGREE